MIQLFMSLLFSVTTFAQDLSPSFLDSTVSIQEFGNIRYRAPLPSSNDRFPILLVHGVYGGASHRTFKNLLPLLDQAGAAVYIVDLPGVGESDKPKRPYRIEDFDQFIEKFIEIKIKKRTTIVAESLLTASALRVSSLRPDLVRRLVLLSPTGINSLHLPPSSREQALYDRLFNDEASSDQFYQNLLVDNSLQFFLKFGFYNDELVNEELLNDFRVMRPNLAQKYLTLSFVGGQLFRPFAESSKNVFIPVLAIFGQEYEVFADNEPSTAEMFKSVRPDFEYLEIPGSGSSVQREKPEAVAASIIEFSVID